MPTCLKALMRSTATARIAGLKSAIACLDMIEVQQLSAILMPQACVMLVDRNAESRQLALSFVESSLRIIKRHHEELAKIPVVEKDKEDKSAKAGEGAGQTSAWTSWAVEGLSKTFERVTTTSQPDGKPSTTTSTDKQASSSSSSGMEPPQKPAAKMVVESTSSITLPASASASSIMMMDQTDDVDMDHMNSAWEDDDFDWSDNIDNDKDEAPASPKQSKPSSSSTVQAAAVKSSPERSSYAASVKEPVYDSKPAIESVKPREVATAKTTMKKAVKLSAKKLDVSDDGDNWDDF
jgi:hypothetical protein